MEVSVLLGTQMARSGDLPSREEEFTVEELGAIPATEALSDRLCIASKGSVDVVLSPQDLVSCDHTCKFAIFGCDKGCQGGVPDNAWKYMTKTGVVSDECMPYTAMNGTDGQCMSTCADGSTFKKYHAKNVQDLKTVEAT